VSHTDGRAAFRAEDVGMLRTRLAAQDDLLSLIALSGVIAAFAEHLSVLSHGCTSLARIWISHPSHRDVLHGANTVDESA
jgi:hypothetical protein